MSKYKSLRVGQLLDVLDDNIMLELWTCGHFIATAMVESYKKGYLNGYADYRVFLIDKIEDNKIIRVWYVQGDDL